MTKILFACIVFFTIGNGHAQQTLENANLDQVRYNVAEIALLKKQLRDAPEDSSKAIIMNLLAFSFSNNLDSGIYYNLKALNFSRMVNYQTGELQSLQGLCNLLKHHGITLKAFNIARKGLRASIKYGHKRYEALFLGELGMLYREIDEYNDAKTELRRSRQLYSSIGEKYSSSYMDDNIGQVYLLTNELDSALLLCRAAWKKSLEKDNPHFWITIYSSQNLGNIFLARGNYDSALYYLRYARRIGTFYSHQFNANLAIARVFAQNGEMDSSLRYAEEAMKTALESGVYSFNAEISDFLTNYYHDKDPETSFHFAQQSLAYKDSVYKQGVIVALENFDELDEQEKLFEIQSAAAAYQFKVRLLGLLAGLIALLIIIGILVRNYRQKQRSIILLNEQKQELSEQRAKLENALTDLKATQKQLIHSEKMASLGELTAGIAHEIQNPLNFVNNFSEVNKELISEMESALSTKNFDDVKDLAKSIADNHEKINQHGKRADAIVKSMLQHSRSSSGQNELTDINSLCNEYLRLAYHGYRAKDKSFNVLFETILDPSLPKVSVVPQDIGRVILNLINNAFYAVNEKSAFAKASADEGYEPRVIITSKRMNGKVEVRIKDNGNGITRSIKEKIFQPFFTTKPTGQGTGLGLSLAYDIITKAHGGDLKVETIEGDGAEFIVSLPIQP